MIFLKVFSEVFKIFVFLDLIKFGDIGLIQVSLCFLWFAYVWRSGFILEYV